MVRDFGSYRLLDKVSLQIASAHYKLWLLPYHCRRDADG